VHYEVDQSGKVEQTNVKTVVALTNSCNFTVSLSGNEKRKLKKYFRDRGKNRQFAIKTFSSLVALTILELKPKHKIIIDTEYQGHGSEIKFNILKTLKRRRLKFIPMIVFGRIGKQSPAHILAIQTYRNKKRACRSIKAREIIALN